MANVNKPLKIIRKNDIHVNKHCCLTALTRIIIQSKKYISIITLILSNLKVEYSGGNVDLLAKTLHSHSSPIWFTRVYSGY